MTSAEVLASWVVAVCSRGLRNGYSQRDVRRGTDITDQIPHLNSSINKHGNRVGQFFNKSTETWDFLNLVWCEGVCGVLPKDTRTDRALDLHHDLRNRTVSFP